MRSFIISSALLVIVLCAIIANAVIVSGTARHICSLADDLKSDTADEATLSELERVWQERHLLLSISVQLDTIERINELIVSLRSAYNAGASQEIIRLCTVISDLCDEIAEYERLSFYAIL